MQTGNNNTAMAKLKEVDEEERETKQNERVENNAKLLVHIRSDESKSFPYLWSRETLQKSKV